MHSTTREFLWLHAKLFFNWVDEEIADAIDTVLKALDLAQRADEPINAMVKVFGPGYIRRVLIARAVMNGCSILLVSVLFFRRFLLL